MKRVICAKCTTPGGIYLFNVSNENTKKMCDIFLMFELQTTETDSGVSIVDFEQVNVG